MRLLPGTRLVAYEMKPTYRPFADRLNRSLLKFPMPMLPVEASTVVCSPG